MFWYSLRAPYWSLEHECPRVTRPRSVWLYRLLTSGLLPHACDSLKPPRGLKGAVKQSLSGKQESYCNGNRRRHDRGPRLRHQDLPDETVLDAVDQADADELVGVVDVAGCGQLAEGRAGE